MSEPAAKHAFPGFDALPPEPRRSGRRIALLATLIFAGQCLFIFVLGTRQPTVPQPVANAPRFTLAAAADEIIALTDPTFFALPHAQDFSATIWTRIPTNGAPDFRVHEAPQWLVLDPKNLGAALRDYLQTNANTGTPLNFKPEPELEVPAVKLEKFFPTNSTLSIRGALAQRPLLSPIALPTLGVNDVIAPTRVQLLVTPEGTVFSAVLLDSCGYTGTVKPDQLALQIANAARFAPADQLTFGEIIFRWHTEPEAGTNSPEPK